MIIKQHEAESKLYAGPAPMPKGATLVGLIYNDNRVGHKGALIQLANGVYVQYNAGCIKSLDQAAVKAALQSAGVKCHLTAPQE